MGRWLSRIQRRDRPLRACKPISWQWKLLSIVLGYLLPAVALAESPLSVVDGEAILRRLEQQEAEIQALRRQLGDRTSADLAPPVMHHAPASMPTFEPASYHAQQPSGSSAGGKSGNDKPAEDDWKDVSGEKWNVKLGGHVQMEYINWAQADPDIVGADNYFAFRRLRLVADGTGYGVCDFRLQMTLEPGEGPVNTSASPDVKDAYFTMNEIPVIGRIRIGNFFVPFSLEQVTNDTNNMFMERSIPTQNIFAADREVGLAFYNCTDSQDITWAGGIFFDSLSDTIKVRPDDNQGYRLSGRVTWLPYYDEPSQGRYLVHTGLGILHTDDHDDRVVFRARPQVQQGPRLIDSGALDADSYTTGNLELAVVMGRVTLQGEAFLSSVNMNTGDAVDVNGAYVHVSYFLTGENRIFDRFGQHGAQFARNQPFTNFFIAPGGIGSGAWEAKARWSRLDLNSIDRGQYNDFTFGFNWYWSDRTRIMWDWIHPVTSDEAVFGATESDLIAMRFDFNW